MKDYAGHVTKWVVSRFASDKDYRKGQPYKVSEIDGNALLNEGINELLLLLTADGGTAFDNTNSYIGVGESSAAVSASQTDLQGSSKTYKAMETGYPSVSGQTVTFRSVFGSGDANHSWQEFTVANGSSGTAKNLNRKVDDQGTKASGQTWTIDLQITFA